MRNRGTRIPPPLPAIIQEGSHVLRKPDSPPYNCAAGIEQFRGCVDTLGMFDPKWAARQQTVRQLHTLCATATALTHQNHAALEDMFKNLAN